MPNKKKVFFRADASETIGYGHFTRSLALAEMLKGDFDCTFFTQSPTEYQRSEVERVCKIVTLPSNDSKYEIFLTYLTGEEIVVLDNYFFTSEYEKRIKDIGCRLVSIGSNDKHYYADAVVNFTNLSPNDFSVEKYTKLCLGLDWTILRKPFYSQSLSEKKENIVICIGGTDQYRFSEAFYSALVAHYPTRRIQIISTDRIGAERITALRQMTTNVCLNLTAEQMVEVLDEAVIAIVSASSIAIEALARKANVIAGFYVQNQQNIYKSLLEDGYIWGVGDFFSDGCLTKVFSSIEDVFRGGKKKLFNPTNTMEKYHQLFSELCI